MNSNTNINKIRAKYFSEEENCSYLPSEKSKTKYLYIENCSSTFYKMLLQRGYRRFGNFFFVPECESCFKCVSIRIVVDSFKLSKSFKRVLNKNSDLKMVIRRPIVTKEHLDLYDKYHTIMNKKRGWEFRAVNAREYHISFIEGMMDYGFELSFYDKERLIGVGLIDILGDEMSSVYFFYDHDYEKRSLGTLSILKQIELARKIGIKYIYPGYWIKENFSMSYKERFKPFEVLKNRATLTEEPIWEI